MAHSARERKESRGAHQRLDGYTERDDERFLVHTLSERRGDDAPAISHRPVVITTSAPRARSYGGAGTKAILT
jgi:fumarate reductase flavoprotein subunit